MGVGGTEGREMENGGKESKSFLCLLCWLAVGRIWCEKLFACSFFLKYAQKMSGENWETDGIGASQRSTVLNINLCVIFVVRWPTMVNVCCCLGRKNRR